MAGRPDSRTRHCLHYSVAAGQLEECADGGAGVCLWHEGEVMHPLRRRYRRHDRHRGRCMTTSVMTHDVRQCASFFDLPLLTDTDPPAETRRPSPAGSTPSAAACAGSHAHTAASAAAARSGTASATGSAARSTARPAAGSAAPSATGPCNWDEEALVESRSIIFVKDIERRQTDVRDVLLIKNHLRAGIVARRIHCGHRCRCATRNGQGNPGGTH